MDIKQFTLAELSDMFLEAVLTQDGLELRKNALNIAKQLLALLITESNEEIRPGHVTAQELEIMINNYENYWNDRFGRGDVEAENADVLPSRIFDLITQLIDTIKRSVKVNVSKPESRSIVDYKYLIKNRFLTNSQKRLFNAICREPTKHLYAKAYLEHHELKKGEIRAALKRLTSCDLVVRIDGIWKIKSAGMQRYWEKVLDGQYEAAEELRDKPE